MGEIWRRADCAPDLGDRATSGTGFCAEARAANLAGGGAGLGADDAGPATGVADAGEGAPGWGARGNGRTGEVAMIASSQDFN
jgi:hypothetical protein